MSLQKSHGLHLYSSLDAMIMLLCNAQLLYTHIIVLEETHEELLWCLLWCMSCGRIFY